MILKIFPGVTRVHTKNLGSIDLAVLMFIGYKQACRQAKYVHIEEEDSGWASFSGNDCERTKLSRTKVFLKKKTQRMRSFNYWNDLKRANVDER